MYSPSHPRPHALTLTLMYLALTDSHSRHTSRPHALIPPPSIPPCPHPRPHVPTITPSPRVLTIIHMPPHLNLHALALTPSRPSSLTLVLMSSPSRPPSYLHVVTLALTPSPSFSYACPHELTLNPSTLCPPYHALILMYLPSYSPSRPHASPSFSSSLSRLHTLALML